MHSILGVQSGAVVAGATASDLGAAAAATAQDQTSTLYRTDLPGKPRGRRHPNDTCSTFSILSTFRPAWSEPLSTTTPHTMAPTQAKAHRIGALLFCPACGTLLDLPKDDQDEIPCAQCGRVEPASCESGGLSWVAL